MVNPLGLLQTSVFQIKTAGFVVAEALFNAHAKAVFSQTSPASDLIGDDGNHFRLAFRVSGPSNRYVGLQFGFTRKPSILKITIAIYRNQMVQSVGRSIWQGELGIAGNADRIIPA